MRHCIGLVEEALSQTGVTYNKRKRADPPSPS
jgi:hypothetical protein